MDQQENNPLEGIKNILELVQTYGGTYVQLTDLVAICVQHIEKDTDIMCDLREMQGDYWVGIDGSPRYIGSELELQMFLSKLLEDFGEIETWYIPTGIETAKGIQQKLEQLKRITKEDV